MAGPSQLEVELEFLRQDPTTLERWGLPGVPGVPEPETWWGVDDDGVA